MSAREAEFELFNLITSIVLPHGERLLFSSRNALTKGITAAGWRPPARTVSTVAELDALPPESVVIDSWGNVYRRDGNGWSPIDHRSFTTADDVTEGSPVTVLHHEGGA